MSVLEIEGAWNVRDVGGMAASDGRIRTGVLLRSGNLSGVTEAGGEVLRSHARHIVDLRDDSEVSNQPTTVTGLPITHLPLFFGSVRSFFAADLTLEQLYAHIIEEGAAKIVEVMRVIAAGEGSLIHCTVGKDRTGISIAIALAAANAEREAIVADYALTESQLPQEFTQGVLGYLRMIHPDAVNIESLATKSPAPVMRALLTGIDAEFGSAGEYLRAHGLSAGELVDLRRALIER